jgi:hypothetical protein
VVGGVQLNPRPEQMELLRRPLPQAPAVHKLLADPNGSGATAEYVRINYFSSDATKAVMRVCSPHCPLSMCSHVLPLHSIHGTKSILLYAKTSVAEIICRQSLRVRVRGWMATLLICETIQGEYLKKQLQWPRIFSTLMAQI